ncbi:hypothetical protein EIP91_003858 [Steccherinum ochraceum]|uniref:P-loop containing nucleoside triphosphate hydrolase protein n=1 Tax=Steccherinum ochraceum TaxID=92696 RepID=A0A4R0RQE5_9APHY|nr:hypothetical protein EIP91_003858 [Steccherinum ochraceum]
MGLAPPDPLSPPRKSRPAKAAKQVPKPQKEVGASASLPSPNPTVPQSQPHTHPAVIVPLCVPRIYHPIDPKHPSDVVHPEQSASILSRLTYFYLDSLIAKAKDVAHLDFNQLPPVPDYDEAAHMLPRNLAILGSYISRKRHIFFGLFKALQYEYIVVFVADVLRSYRGQPTAQAQTGGEGASMRPWFWILWLFLGPMIDAIADQYRQFVLNCVAVRSSATITQLIFDHALRIRLKAEARREPTSGSTTAVATPDNASLNDQQPVASAAADSGMVEEPKSKSDNFVGRLNNLVTSDVTKITTDPDLLVFTFFIPAQLTLSIIFLYSILGWSSLIGLAATAAVFPLPGTLTRLMSGTQKMQMQKSDARVQAVTETMSVIRMVKLFGWEGKMNEKIAKKREEELVYIRRVKFFETLIGLSSFALPFVTTIATFGIYSIVMKRELTASVVFSSMIEFNFGLSQVVFLAWLKPKSHSTTELLDGYGPDYQRPLDNPVPDPYIIGFRDALFTWDANMDGTSTPQSNFKLHIDDELLFKNREFSLVVGPTGSGKTSLLMALLGEMHYTALEPLSYFNLPREDGVAYASQESWVQNETIRDNILFGTEYEEERYKAVIEQCGLQRDLELFEAGDLTEVGEKGLTLSGGQKARVTLARAVYSRADILLLDDVLAALDVHTAKWIVEKCFKGDLIKGRTVILVTHNIALMRPVASFVVSLGLDGTVTNSGTLTKVLAKDSQLFAELESEENELAQEDVDVVERPSSKEVAKTVDGKLVVAEEIAVGRVGWSTLKLFFGSLGGERWLLWWGAFILNMTITPFLETLETWYLGYWANQYEHRPASEVSASYYLSNYSALLLLSCTISVSGYLYFIEGAVRVSRIIHEKLVASVLASTMRWLDITPTSRVISRCTQDIGAVDDTIPTLFSQVVEVTMFMIAKFVAVLLIAPATLVPGLLVAIAAVSVGQVYLKAQRSVKREMSNAQSPVIAHIGAAMAGLVSIRAYGAQEALKRESYIRIDRLTRTSRAFRDINRWMAIRMEVITSLFVVGIAIYLVYGKGVTASDTGFAMNMAIGFCEVVKYAVFAANRVEVQGNSLERIQQYLDIEHEPKPSSDGVPPAYWPSSGKLIVEGLSARYSADGPSVLHDVSFTVNSGERVGIVGRTGSGKSSLTLALLRCILTEGKVFLDDLPTNSINLDSLRSSITIIPQVPELLSGTIRQNLDPFEEHDDAVLNDALRASGLFSLQRDDDAVKLTLDSAIASGGGNLSVGQRQILALARAMVRRSKLLILDEATSAIDNETDNAIQESLRTGLDKDVTLLTIAHRLQTVMDADKIMVLDAGRLVEFGSPRELLKNKDGVLRALVDESGDKDNLHSLLR